MALMGHTLLLMVPTQRCYVYTIHTIHTLDALPVSGECDCSWLSASLHGVRQTWALQDIVTQLPAEGLQYDIQGVALVASTGADDLHDVYKQFTYSQYSLKC